MFFFKILRGKLARGWQKNIHLGMRRRLLKEGLSRVVSGRKEAYKRPGGIKLQRSGQFFSSRVSLRLFKGSPRSRTSRGPLAHTFIRRNKSFSGVKNLATGLLIICQKEEIPVIFRKNRHALLTCGTEVTQRFIPYCQLSCVLPSSRL